VLVEGEQFQAGSVSFVPGGGGNTNLARFVEDSKQRKRISENILLIIICNAVCFYLHFLPSLVYYAVMPHGERRLLSHQDILRLDHLQTIPCPNRL